MGDNYGRDLFVLKIVNFRHSDKATQICPSSTSVRLNYKWKMDKNFVAFSEYPYFTDILLLSDAGTGGAGGPLSPPIFGRSVNPIQIGEGRLSPHITTGPPQCFSPSRITATVRRNCSI